MTVLVIAENDHHSVKGEAFNCVMAAAQMTLFLDSEVHIMMVGPHCHLALLEASHIPGVTKIIQAGDEQKMPVPAQDMVDKILSRTSGYSHILFPDTASGNNMALRIAAELDVLPIRDVSKVLSADAFETSVSDGNAVTTTSDLDDVVVMTVSTHCFDAVPAKGGSAVIERVDGLAPAVNSTHGCSKSSKNKRLQFTGTKITVRDGYALDSSEKFIEISI